MAALDGDRVAHWNKNNRKRPGIKYLIRDLTSCSIKTHTKIHFCSCKIL